MSNGATVRDAAFAVMRQFGMTTIFGNPGSTEIAFLTDLPPDLRFVLALHEGSVVGMATGYAIAREEPAFVNLHTAPGLGNAVNAIVNARDCGAPLVIVVGQQDRRQLAFEPFLTGRGLERLAGENLVWSSLPVRAQDVPGAIGRAYHEAMTHRGPALVVVPMGDWLEPADDLAAGTPAAVDRSRAVAPAEMARLAELIGSSRSPAFVVGAGSDSREGWDGLVALAERVRAPVWQESFVRRAGFPQDHPLFAGFLPWQRKRMRRTLSGHDLVVAIGTGAFRLYLLDEYGPMVEPGTRVAVLTDKHAEAYRSPCDLAVIAPVAAACSALSEQVAARNGAAPAGMRRPARVQPPGDGEPLAPAHVFDALAERLAPETVLVEETPSSQPELYQRIPIRAPLGFVACANGGLGFGLSGAIGLRMGLPDRPVVAVLGDGSAMYAIQALWSAAHYDTGVLLIVMSNGAYAVMDNLAQDHGGRPPWPAFNLDMAGIAEKLGCPATRVTTHSELIDALDRTLPGLTDARQPQLLEIKVQASSPPSIG